MLKQKILKVNRLAPVADSLPLNPVPVYWKVRRASLYRLQDVHEEKMIRLQLICMKCVVFILEKWSYSQGLAPIPFLDAVMNE